MFLLNLASATNGINYIYIPIEDVRENSFTGKDNKKALDLSPYMSLCKVGSTKPYLFQNIKFESLYIRVNGFLESK